MITVLVSFNGPTLQKQKCAAQELYQIDGAAFGQLTTDLPKREVCLRLISISFGIG